MKYQVLEVSSHLEVENIYSKMDLIYGSQAHLLSQLVLLASTRFPGLVNIALDKDSEQVGHIVFIPFNELGKDKILSPALSEAELSLDHIYDPARDKNAYIFVYSIYSQSFRLTKVLIEKTVKSLQQRELSLGVNAEIFTEVVTKEGRLLAEKLSLNKSFEYLYEAELIHIYNSKLTDFVSSF